jgi:XTP/dITP diphosphohydrolase
LVVDALGGAPGIYSARFAGSHATDNDNNIKLLKELALVPDEKRTARFYCALVFVKDANDPTPIICEASWEGSILHTPQGNNGFGYDSLFWVPTHNCSSAQLTPNIKNLISHRGQALRALAKRLTSSI